MPEEDNLFLTLCINGYENWCDPDVQFIRISSKCFTKAELVIAHVTVGSALPVSSSELDDKLNRDRCRKRH